MQTRGAKLNNNNTPLINNLNKLQASVLKFELVSKQSNEQNLYTIDFNLILKKSNATSNSNGANTILKRKLIKCDLCTYACILDSSIENNFDFLCTIKNHILNKHLINLEDIDSSEDESTVSGEDSDPENLQKNKAKKNNLIELNKTVKSVLNSLIRRVEIKLNTTNIPLYSYKCCINKCNLLFNTKTELTKHIEKQHSNQIEKVMCLYCRKLFNVNTNRQITDYFDHLKIEHAELVRENFLLVDLLVHDDSQEVHRDSDELNLLFNWQEYFADECEWEDSSDSSSKASDEKSDAASASNSGSDDESNSEQVKIYYFEKKA